LSEARGYLAQATRLLSADPTRRIALPFGMAAGVGDAATGDLLAALATQLESVAAQQDGLADRLILTAPASLLDAPERDDDALSRIRSLGPALALDFGLQVTRRRGGREVAWHVDRVVDLVEHLAPDLAILAAPAAMSAGEGGDPLPERLLALAAAAHAADVAIVLDGVATAADAAAAHGIGAAFWSGPALSPDRPAASLTLPCAPTACSIAEA
ncbi:MAG: hypothetical protein AAFZ09_08775, partial [Pseudomonadota bacterium]